MFSEEFSVQAKADATNVAYTSGYLQLHTDLPYYEYKPGVLLFTTTTGTSMRNRFL